MKKIKLTALIAALIAGVGIYFFLKEIGKPAEVPRTSVVVAVQNIPQNTRITADMVALRPVATEALHEHYLLDTESAVGYVASSDIFPGEQIISDRLVRTGEIGEQSTTLAYVVENGMRAISIKVDVVTGLETLLKPGNHVDVIAYYPFTYTEEEKAADEIPEDDEEPEKFPVTGMIVQNRTILAVGPELRKEGSEESYITVTLQVTPTEALTVDYAERYNAYLRLVLRSPLDNETVTEHDMTLERFMEEVSES